MNTNSSETTFRKLVISQMVEGGVFVLSLC